MVHSFAGWCILHVNNKPINILFHSCFLGVKQLHFGICTGITSLLAGCFVCKEVLFTLNSQAVSMHSGWLVHGTQGIMLFVCQLSLGKRNKEDNKYSFSKTFCYYSWICRHSIFMRFLSTRTYLNKIYLIILKTVFPVSLNSVYYLVIFDTFLNFDKFDNWRITKANLIFECIYHTFITSFLIYLEN